MNVPPDEHINVSHQRLHAFVSTAAQTVGMRQERAEMLASLLTTNDLRGIFSHGTQQIATYAILMRDGKLNKDPQTSLVKETPVSALVDGDGGLGYFPAYEGTLMALDKAEKMGIAAMMSRNHGHFGAAGIYARLAVGRGLAAYVTSGHQLHLEPGDTLNNAAGGSPMAFGVVTKSRRWCSILVRCTISTTKNCASRWPSRRRACCCAQSAWARSARLGAGCCRV